jgi:glycerol-3-phosphate acyltransferase PlsX
LAQICTIAVDVMSGDHGPRVCVPAALAMLREHEHLQLVLVGAADDIAARVRADGCEDHPHLSIHPATQVVAMDEPPREALRRKKDSSLRQSIELVKAGRAAACVSAGNTGALMAMAHFVLKPLPGVERPAIVSALPSTAGHTHMLDLGANTVCTAGQLFQFGVMGAVVASGQAVLERPRVGLLNIGEEDIKGHETVRDAHRRFAASGLNYIGFVEGDDIFSGEVDVVVTDGFTGNVALKTIEGTARMIGAVMREEFTRGAARKLMAAAARPALMALKQRLDPRQYNGASMVGLNGIVIKSHGGADQTAFAYAIRTAAREAARGVPARIVEELRREDQALEQQVMQAES